jgi:hypothetical protein
MALYVNTTIINKTENKTKYETLGTVNQGLWWGYQLFSFLFDLHINAINVREIENAETNKKKDWRTYNVMQWNLIKYSYMIWQNESYENTWGGGGKGGRHIRW